MSTYVLVPGAWLGGWCWRRLAEYLRGDGHQVYPATLTGLGERTHLGAPDVGLATHVQDVINLLEYEDLSEVVLVGHSYAGIVIAGVVQGAAQRVSRLIFLDANLPINNRSIFDEWSPRGRELVMEDCRTNGEGWKWHFPGELGEAGSDISETDLKRMSSKASPHPIKTFTDPLHFSEELFRSFPKTYALCSKVAHSQATLDRINNEPDWKVINIDAGHWPMISAADRLTKALQV
ncbi:MAG: alpha/beta hydrolase [Nitrososphaerota archaeon]|nr:alpha/beta hydrolase [Nitrososphaerota archaeon]